MSAKETPKRVKTRIPKDVEEYFSKRIFKRAALCVTAIAAVTAMFLLGLFEGLGTFNEVLLWILALVACVIFVFKPA